MTHKDMISIIIQEHNEGKEFVQKMIRQVAALPQKKELLFVTSATNTEFLSKYGPFREKFPVSIFGNIHSPGNGRSLGGQKALGDTLVFMDCHVCFTTEKMKKLIATLEQHPNSAVGPALQMVDFPSCKVEGGTGYGIAFSFIDQPFKWNWVQEESKTNIFRSPFICACQFAIKKDTFNHLLRYGGFLSPPVGVGMEEEIFMRLQRLGHPVLIDPTITFGHLFKGYAGKPTWDEHSNSGWFYPRVAAIYVNVFNEQLWNTIEPLCIKHWGNLWTDNLVKVKQQYEWLRTAMRPFANKIDENWFFRTR